MFDYVFTEPQPGGSMPRIEPRVVDGPFEACGVRIQVLPVFHGKLSVFGYRIGKLSYITDCSEIPEETFRILRGTSILVLGVLRYEPHPTHLSVGKAEEIIRRVSPDQTYFTHLSHDFDHDRANDGFPPGIRLSYDGLTFEMDEP